VKATLLRAKTIGFTVQNRLFWIAKTALLQSKKMMMEREI